MELRKNIFTALLIAIGFIIRQVTPSSIGGMHFDGFLSVMFVCILINDDFKNAMLTAFLGGVITAMTTTFPGGQIPNILDKFVTCLVLYAIIKVLGNFKSNPFVVGGIAFIGTLLSGSSFLIAAKYMVGLPVPFAVLFTGIVLPTSFMNIIITLSIYKAVTISMRALGMNLVRP
ncbi:tryptophan transporter [Clostridiaceae bacterium 35-E11]